MPLEEILAMINFASQSFALYEHCFLTAASIKYCKCEGCVRDLGGTPH